MGIHTYMNGEAETERTHGLLMIGSWSQNLLDCNQNNSKWQRWHSKTQGVNVLECLNYQQNDIKKGSMMLQFQLGVDGNEDAPWLL